jgi:hypothetical protein
MSRSHSWFPAVEERHKDGMKQRIDFLKSLGATEQEISTLLRKPEREIRHLSKRPYSAPPDEGPLSGWKYESADLEKALNALWGGKPWKALVADYD